MATSATEALRVREETLHFEVDAALLEELGQRLIGRSYIALAELVKNAYDADARRCEIRFEDDAIEIVDDGHGMKFDEFRNRWMRIASTHKVREEFSRELKRPLTGSKGIGRLSVQFLADRMQLVTRAKRSGEVLEANVDWQQIQPGEELATVEVRCERRPRSDEKFANGRDHGVMIRLDGLRDTWSPDDLRDLARELWNLQPPFRGMLRSGERVEFEVSLSSANVSEQKAFEEATAAALDRNWRARIIGRVRRRRDKGIAHLRIEFKGGYGAPWPETKELDLPFPLYPRTDRPTDELRDPRPCVEQARFEIRVYRRHGRQSAGVKLAELTRYLDNFGGVDIFDAGFRLPYYNRQDWLDIEQDYSRRVSVSQLLPKEIRQQTRALLDLPPRRNLLGVVLVDTGQERKSAQETGLDARRVLSINPGRDRLTHNTAYYQLKHIVRASLDLYANLYRGRTLASEGVKIDPGKRVVRDERLKSILGELIGEIDEETASRVDKALRDYTRAAAAEAEGLRRSLGLFGAIATAGMNAIAFSHELSREMRSLESIVSELRSIAKFEKNKAIAPVVDRLSATTKSISSLRSLFSLVTDRRADGPTKRLGARIVIEETEKSIRPILPGITIEFDAVPKGLLLPRGTMAEWSAVFQNVFSNAWNAMLKNGGKIIRCEGEALGNGGVLWISDQGQGLGVPLSESDDLFEPFKRAIEIEDRLRPMMIGGQGIGLAIVKMIADSRGVDVRFVEPVEGFATTLELSWERR